MFRHLNGCYVVKEMTRDWYLTYADGELDKDGTYKKFLLVRQEGKRQVRRNIDHYNLDVIIALGYKGAVGEQ